MIASDRRSSSLTLTLTLSLTLSDLNLTIFLSILCLVSGRRSEPIIILFNTKMQMAPVVHKLTCDAADVDGDTGNVNQGNGNTGNVNTGNVNQGVWSGVNLSLCAVNLGNVAGHTLPTDKLAEMYALLAMTVRLYLPASSHFLVVSYFTDLFKSVSYHTTTSPSWQ